MAPRRRNAQRGSIMPLFCVALALLFGFGALSIDVGYFYYQKARLQITADNAALAAAVAISETPGDYETTGPAYALSIVEHNMPESRYGAVLSEGEIEFGTWDENTKTFSPGGSDIRAVRVTTYRRASNDNAASTFFLRAFGFKAVDIQARAVAFYALGDCSSNGVRAGNEVTFGEDARISGNTCIYGRNSVSFGEDAEIMQPAKVGALNLSDINFGEDPTYPESALFADDIPMDASNNIAQVINDIEAGAGLPPAITNVSVVSKLPKTLTNGTAYVVNGNVNIGEDYDIENVIIAARGRISFGEDGSITNTNNCSSGARAIGLYATQNISLGEDATARDVEIVSGNNVSISEDVKGLSVSIEAANNVTIDEDPQITGCKSALGTVAGSSASVRLVL